MEKSHTIVKIEYLEGPHGEEAYATCEKCNRKIKWLATLDDGREMGVECAKTECLPEELKRATGRMKRIKSFWSIESLTTAEKVEYLKNAKDDLGLGAWKMEKGLSTREKSLRNMATDAAYAIYGRK